MGSQDKLSDNQLNACRQLINSLTDIIEDISTNRNIEKILLSIVKYATKSVRADAAGICLYDSEGHFLTRPVFYKFPKYLVDELLSLGAADPVAKIVMKSKKPFIEKDYEQSEYRLQQFIDAGVKSIVRIPILTRNEAIGMLGICATKQKRDFSESETELLMSFAKHAGIAFENSRLLKDARVSRAMAESVSADLEIINNMSLQFIAGLEVKDTCERIIKAAIKLVGGDFGGLMCMREDKPVFYFANMPENIRQAIEESLVNDEYNPAKQVLHTGTPLLVHNYPEFKDAIQPLISYGVKSLIAVPIGIGKNRFGVIAINSNSYAKFNGRHLQLMQGIAAQAAIALENSRLYEKLHDAYEEERRRTIILQKSFLPSIVPTVIDLEIAAFYESATESALIGGDFYDVIPFSPTQAAFVVGDVSGKGIEAAATTSVMRNVLRSFAYQNPDPSFVLDNTNNIVLKQVDPGMFITTIYLLYKQEEETVYFVNAGHPYLIKCDSTVRSCDEFMYNDPACCLIKDNKYAIKSISFASGDAIIMYTDGLTEARKHKQFYGIERVMKAIADTLGCSAVEIADNLIRSCRTYTDNHLTDDVAVLVLKRK